MALVYIDLFVKFIKGTGTRDLFLVKVVSYKRSG